LEVGGKIVKPERAGVPVNYGGSVVVVKMINVLKT